MPQLNISLLGAPAILIDRKAIEQKARGALRRTPSVLRSALADRWLEAEGAITTAPDPAWK